MARLFYSVLYYLIFPLVLLRLWWRGKDLPAYRENWKERLGIFRSPGYVQEPLWVHAVSVGETIAAAPLVKALRKKYPYLPVVFTVMTPTGRERAEALLGDDVQLLYAPYDTPLAVQAFLRRIKPVALIVIETELWPNWIHICHRRQIPTILANGRMSERSARGYLKVRPLSKKMFARLTWIAAQNQADADRFLRLGADPERVSVTGSVKFDLALDPAVRERGLQLREGWGGERVAIIAGSTHEGEDEAVLSAFRELLKQEPDCLLMLVPRHPERFEVVAELLERSGLQWARRSQCSVFSEATQVVLGDTMGELAKLYAACDIAFVGGSLFPIGGHNPLEPAYHGMPVLTGEHIFNFQTICERLEEAGALVYVDGESLLPTMLRLVQDQAERSRRGEAAQQFVAKNRGALERLLAGIDAHLPSLQRLAAADADRVN